MIGCSVSFEIVRILGFGITLEAVEAVPLASSLPANKTSSEISCETGKKFLSSQFTLVFKLCLRVSIYHAICQLDE
jgi:hypothetical protein